MSLDRKLWHKLKLLLQSLKTGHKPRTALWKPHKGARQNLGWGKDGKTLRRRGTVVTYSQSNRLDSLQKVSRMRFPFQFQKHNHDLQATKTKLMEAANYVDKVRAVMHILQEYWYSSRWMAQLHLTYKVGFGEGNMARRKCLTVHCELPLATVIPPLEVFNACLLGKMYYLGKFVGGKWYWKSDLKERRCAGGGSVAIRSAIALLQLHITFPSFSHLKEAIGEEPWLGEHSLPISVA